MIVKSFRDGQVKEVEYCRGNIVKESDIVNTDEPNGVYIKFRPDSDNFNAYSYKQEYVETMLRNYTYLNAGLIIMFNGQKFVSKNGLLDLLNENMSNPPIYPPIHIKGNDIEVALTHERSYGEDYYSFVNGQHTTQGGTHLISI
jgi:topoisomerase IV subunit B